MKRLMVLVLVVIFALSVAVLSAGMALAGQSLRGAVLPKAEKDAANGYKILKQGAVVVSWVRDREYVGSRQRGFYYDFVFYRLNPQTHHFVIEKEAYTKKRVPLSVAKSILPAMAESRGSDLVVSNDSTFAKDALRLATKHFGKRYIKAIRSSNSEFAGPIDDEVRSGWRGARSYAVGLKGAYVSFHRDGSAPEVNTMEEGSF